MEKEKYYTPTIEEFHVGFEYEEMITNSTFRQDADVFVKRIFSNKMSNRTDELTCIDYDLGSGGYNVRVKYLDREDIESFGFKEDEKSKGFFLHKEERFFVSFDYWLNKSDYSFMNVKVGDEQNEYDFAGVIKNKSEFSRLLKQLSII